MMNRIFAALYLMSMPMLASAMPVVYFDFDGDGLQDGNHTVTAGESLTADVYISGMDEVHGGLISFGTEIGFDSNLLSVSGYSIDPVWLIPGATNEVDNETGITNLSATSLVTGYSGTIQLFELTMDTLSSGMSQLVIGELFPDHLQFSGFAGQNGYDYDADIVFNGADIEITAVPLPPSLVLFAGGLVSLVSLGRRKLLHS